MQHIDHFDRLYGENATITDSEFLFSELLETRSCVFEWDIKPHIHPRLFQLFFVEKGKFKFYDVKQQTQLEGPCLILIPPTTLHGFIYDPDATGRILSMNDTLADSMLKESSALASLIRNIQIIKTFDEIYSPESIKTITETIDKEFHSQLPEKQWMLKAYLQQLFLVIYRLQYKNDAASTESGPISFVYFRKFQQQMHQKGKTKTIARLAEELTISPEHLNRICRQIAGKSAGQLLQEHTLEEAYKYLVYTSYSISEIAYLLNFEYPNYFARFFRKHTGLSPKEFREQRNIK